MGIIHQKSGPHTPKQNRTSRIMRNWGLIGRWEVPLSAVLNGRHGRRRGKFVYTVSYGTLPIYTGMTRKTVQSRLYSHVRYLSNLGQCIKAAPVEMFTLEVLEIDGNVWAAERHRIQQLRPPVNIAEHYHSKELAQEFVKAFIKANIHA